MARYNAASATSSSVGINHGQVRIVRAISPRVLRFSSGNAGDHGQGFAMALAIVESLRANRRGLAGMGSKSWWV